MHSGASLFARYAFPPNELGYCGPADQEWERDLEGDPHAAERDHIVRQFDGAWPYLEFIGGYRRMDPLDPRVVEAYWLGNELLDGIDMLVWGNAIEERFRYRAGSEWSAMENSIVGGRPTHAYHVFCVYPWAGLLRSGHTDQALHVIDRCRIRWGTVEDVGRDRVMVASQPLIWDGSTLTLGPAVLESVRFRTGHSPLRVGSAVSLHWDYVCDVIGTAQSASIARETSRHLAIVNAEQKHLAGVVEG
jgi:hypothetical protein